MLARELIEILSKNPEYLVQIETPDVVDHVIDVDIDCFDEEEGMTFVLKMEDV
ncbi:hypothetical protein SEA_WOFFORD_26 [Streptomyces phage Wofford]|uniref:Uncharacterized protein n=1 Tax=Streptomyces phage Wofford TaxID=2283267 RepID=A0A345M9Q2_9CAUD|nr:hypothetical protein HWB78_gp026 [Streptomyces phage Wollford]AXH67223.1 hypothetical protein SEA_WOFFORD_26 [Streptomyces phage Wollford]